MSRTQLHLAAIAAAALAVGCGELPQDGPKPFVSAAETRSQWGSVQDKRSEVQDEYATIPGARERAKTVVADRK